ncbi:3-deoxy-D-manno-octulosonate 8-phosphate phosphatase [Corynebacterium sp. HMSC074A09]|nr:3-deoxy-D-manno-octulosonate 8-phosphate phosphatase [Corynebacterium sp. HMSC074A09]
MVTASRSLKKRQELRQRLEEEQRKLRDRKKSINSLLSLIEQRDKLNEKIGQASQSIIDLGEAKEFVRELVGVSQRDFNDMLKTAKESSPSAEDSSGDDESHAGNDEGRDNDEAASATEDAGGDGADENSDQ